MKRYENKVVWIIGAQLPIGKALVKAFADEGARLILSGVSEAPDGIDAILCCPENPINDEIARGTLKDISKLDSVVFVQPDSPDMSVENCTVDFWETELYNGLGAAFCACRAAMRIMGPVKKGNFCCVSTIHDSKPNGKKLMLSVCAGGLNMLMREAAQDYSRLGGDIRANIVEVGPLEGDEERMSSSYLHTYWTLNTRIPRGKPGTPEECTGAVLFLCSDDASYINGATLRIDGGFVGYYSDTDAEARWKYGYT